MIGFLTSIILKIFSSGLMRFWIADRCLCHDHCKGKALTVRVLTRVGKENFRKIHESKILLLNCPKTKYFSHLHVSISGKPRQFINSIHDLSKIAILTNILTEHTIPRAIPVEFAVMASVIFPVSFKNSIILWISALRYVVLLN